MTDDDPVRAVRAALMAEWPSVAWSKPPAWPEGWINGINVLVSDMHATGDLLGTETLRYSAAGLGCDDEALGRTPVEAVRLLLRRMRP